ncbi:TetR family transcriptional regulator [Streptomyces spiralis]|uniref:TetR family transcriptional regulator n=1 Tax=Streptomyces spiralis TaxID=66376 RepID=A0A919E6B6_9ACTN|nr:TetR/AcrR family transcriptional regulator [Streptomyces spiralis]GHF18422.1 TetR family transcriptional regulator [Streptomyces spiralis]
MPRPREFDEQEAVARAAKVFHRRGYHATSTRDLGEALALNPSSIYRTFSDKHGLFLRALDHYLAGESVRCTAALEADRPVREALRDWLYSMVEPTDLPGCFVIHTATELGTSDPETRRRVDEAFEGTTAAIAALLRRGVAAGELPADLDADVTADLLFTTLTGLRVRHRAGHDTQRLRTAVDQVLRVLD